MKKRGEPMKKNLSMIITIMIIFSLIPASIGQQVDAGETYYGFSTYKDLYGNINFTDLDGHWAREPVIRVSALSIIKGMGYNDFLPDDTLTREQAIVLLVRLMGLEAEAQKAGEASLGNNDTGKYTILNHGDYWARGYLEVAQNNNILTQDEINSITSFTPSLQEYIDEEIEDTYEVYEDDDNLTNNQLQAIRAEVTEKIENKYSWKKPAKREQVAVWVYRVLGLEPIYGKDQYKIYSLNDYDKIETQNIPIIEAILQNGIMSGDNIGKFNPSLSITRGEMAELLDNIFEDFLIKMEYKIGTGIVDKTNTMLRSQDGIQIDEKILTVKNDDNSLINIIIEQSQNPLYDKGFVGFKSGQLVFPNEINKFDYIKYYISPENKVIFVEVLDKPELVIEGFVERTDSESYTISITDLDENNYTYKVSPGADIKINDQSVRLNDLLYGQEITLGINNGNVIIIDGYLDIGEEGYIPKGGRIHIGKVLEINTENDSITLIDDEEEQEFIIYPSASIIKDDEYIGLSGIKEGDIVRLEFDTYQGNIPSKVYVAAPDKQIENLIKAKLYMFNRSRDEIILTDVSYYDYTIWKDNPGDMKIPLSDSAEIYFDGKKIPKGYLNDYIGKELYIVTNNNYSKEEAIRLVFKNGYERKYYNKLQKITYGDNRIEVDYSDMFFDDSTIIVKDGRLIHPYNLRLDEEIFVISQNTNNTASFISVETPNNMQAILYKDKIYDISKYSFKLWNYDRLSNSGWNDINKVTTFEISEETSIIDFRGEEPKAVSVEAFNNSRLYPADVDKDDNYRDEYIYAVEYDNMITAIDIVPSYSSEEIITSATVNDVDITNNTITIEQIKDWNEFRQKWNINISNIDIDVSQAILIKNGKRSSLDNIKNGDKLYIIRKNNIGHLVIVE